METSKASNTESNSSSNIEALASDLKHNLSLGSKNEEAAPIDSNVCVFASREVRFKFARDLLPKIPYIEAALSGNFPQVQDGDGVVQLDGLNPALLRPILKYVKTNQARHLLTKLSCKESVVELFQTLDFLCVPSPADMSLANLQRTLTSIADVIDQKEARNSAVSLTLSIHLDKFDLSDHRIRTDIFNKMNFICSHSHTFHRRMRFHVNAVYTFKVKPYLTAKQHRKIDGWYNRGNPDQFDPDDSHSDESPRILRGRGYVHSESPRILRGRGYALCESPRILPTHGYVLVQGRRLLW